MVVFIITINMIIIIIVDSISVLNLVTLGFWAGNSSVLNLITLGIWTGNYVCATTLLGGLLVASYGYVGKLSV